MKRAFIFNNYLKTSGGGERSSFEIASVLENMGFSITFSGSEKLDRSLKELADVFGIKPKTSWHYRQFDTVEEIFRCAGQEEYDLFVNHTFGSFRKNPCPVGIYVAMFPIHTSEYNVAQLNNYDYIFCISDFVAIYLKRHWSPYQSTKVIIPPISAAHFHKDPVHLVEKEKLIIQIGRYNVAGHVKRHIDAIRAFATLYDDGILDDSWQMVVAGHLNHSEENVNYFNSCVSEATGYNIEVKKDLAFDELQALYRRAAMIWQFTGFGSNFGHRPEECEHLGLVAQDGFAYGTLPTVFHRSGIAYEIAHGQNGFVFGTLSELQDIMQLMVSNFGGPLHEYWLEQSKLKANTFSFDDFQAEIRETLGYQFNHP